LAVVFFIVYVSQLNYARVSVRCPNQSLYNGKSFRPQKSKTKAITNKPNFE